MGSEPRSEILLDLPINVSALEGVSTAPQYSARGKLLGYRWFAFCDGVTEQGDAENAPHALHRARRRLEIMRKVGPREV